MYRDDPETEVLAFTATQIPYIDDRTYPAALAGERYPDGIPIHEEAELARLINELDVDDVVFSYSDVTHEHVMDRGSTGSRPARIRPAGPGDNARRDGAGGRGHRGAHRRRQDADDPGDRRALKDAGKRVVAVRHPMPYGDLVAQRVQRYAVLADLDRYETTIEEREEYEPHITTGTVIYAGVDYGESSPEPRGVRRAAVGRRQQRPAVLPPTVHLALVDPLRAGHELRYHPARTCAWPT